MSNLEKLRQKINKIDRKLLKTLAERFKITKKIGIYKKRHDLPIEDKKRETAILRKIKRLAKSMKLDEKLAQDVFKLTIKKSKAINKKLKKL